MSNSTTKQYFLFTDTDSLMYEIPTADFTRIYLKMLRKRLIILITQKIKMKVVENYSSNSPKRPPWGQKNVAVVERWPLWKSRGVI